jgi:ubiquinone/menaquinone biosynthesis C-methylase UbiE
MNDKVKKWLKDRAEIFLQEIGIQKGQKVLDFGCHEGTYTISAARIVGEKGRVYAVDADGKALAKTMKKIKSASLKNVVGMIPSNELELPLDKATVDAILIYDILHRGYFPETKSRQKILSGLFKALKKNGFMSVYLTHLNRYGMTFKKALKEIEDTGFICKGEVFKKLIHDGALVRGRIFTFRKQ